ncbi:MAG: hypothetical protein Q8P92_00205 [Candidatus Daviesbacteria bacterium]|nr:hypothetical protein [Candidatus Daviesbacteria bacterium]
MLIILTGKTASGKDTIKQRILHKFPDVKRVITTTSRAPREGEQQDIDYHFISREGFQKKIDAGDFIEYVEYGGNLYGTTKIELDKTLDENLLWKIDPSRAGEIRDFIRRSFPSDQASRLVKNILVIYITTSDEVILERLRRRNLSSNEIEKRMMDDLKIWHKYQRNYDYVIENVPGKLDETVDKIFHIIL